MRTLPIVFNQTDYLQKLGTGIQTIAQSGCYLCAYTSLAKACGKNLTPINLNKFFVDKLLYVNSNEMVDDNLTKVYPDIIYQETLNYQSVPADLNKLKELVGDPSTWVILEIDLGNKLTHFVLCVGVNGIVSIADSMSGTIIDFASKYGDPAKNILKFVVYKGNVPATSIVDQATIDQLRLERDKNWSLYQEQILTTKQFQDQVGTLQKKLDELQKNYDSEKLEVIALNKTIEGQASSNKDYAAAAYAAETLAREREDYLFSLVDNLGVNRVNKKDADITEAALQKISKLKKPIPIPLPSIDNSVITDNTNNMDLLKGIIKDIIELFVKSK